MENHLEFEKPIIELERKMAEMKSLAKRNNVDADSSIQNIELKLMELKKSVYSGLTRWQRVQMSRHPNRPYTLDYLMAIAQDFIELHGDRGGKDDRAIIGGLASISGRNVMMIGHQKGRDTKERTVRNFGMSRPEGYRKALRLMKLAEKFCLPVFTFVDTPGAYPGIGAEERGQSEASAATSSRWRSWKCPSSAPSLAKAARVAHWPSASPTRC